MNATRQPLAVQAVEALKRGERRKAIALLEQEVEEGPPTGGRWRSISLLAMEIAAINVAIEAARRAAASPPSLEGLLNYWATLNTYGRTDQALADLARYDQTLQQQPAVLHFRATLAGEQGRFDEAHELFRKALAIAPEALQIWFGFAMAKTFEPGDPDLAAMEALAANAERADADSRARLFYALGKAWDDAGDPDRAFSWFAKGAAIRAPQQTYNPAAAASVVERIIGEFTPEALATLRPSGPRPRRSLFVTGLPRSGTTLVEQILVAHSQVSDGAEVNFVKPALIPTIGFNMPGALAYQERSASDDPWGEIAADYAGLIDTRFPSRGLVVDKSLSQSMLMGLQLHSLSDARVVWLRRDPQDVAWSCFRTYFTAIPWSWSFSNIAWQMRLEDRMFEHWRKVFPDRILPIQYEELVRDPATWIPRILGHFGLPEEAGVHEFHRNRRTVRTASVRQVRAPLSASSIGQSRRYERPLEEFRRAYEEK